MLDKCPRPALSLLAASLLATVLLAGCGGDDSGADGDQPDAGLTRVRSYLTDHAGDLTAQTAELKSAGNAYFDLAKTNGFRYARMLNRDCTAVDAALSDAKNAFIRANPAYMEMKAIVAGIPRTAQYDTDIGSGSDASDPTNPVSFNLRLPGGQVMAQPGNLFYLIETSLYGTDPDLLVKGVKPDVNCDGRVEFGEGLPEARALKAAVDEIDRQASDLQADAGEIIVTPSDAFTAITVMTPTMGEYFEQWKDSAFVTGERGRQEDAFVATSRLSDIADVLAGIEFTYGEIEPLIAEQDADQAAQIATEISNLRATAEALRDREATGEKFSPDQAERLGDGMQARAERIAAQVTQAARDLEIELQED